MSPTQRARTLVVVNLCALVLRNPTYLFVAATHDMLGGSTFATLVTRYARGGRKGRAALRKLTRIGQEAYRLRSCAVPALLERRRELVGGRAAEGAVA